MSSTTDVASTADTPAARRRPAKRRAEGQWALGYREPLNANEQAKKDDNPLNVRRRIEDIYAHQGFDSIDKSDLRGRFRWWGLYTQREQGYDGTYTGDENLDLLEAKYFMMRVRCDGGALDVEQLRTIGGISTEFGRDTADLSDRQNVQYHWIEVENVPEIWRRLESVGLKTTERAATARALYSVRRSQVNPSTRSSTGPRPSTRSSVATSATPSTRTCRANSRLRSPASRTSCTRSTTSHSSV